MLTAEARGFWCKKIKSNYVMGIGQSQSCDKKLMANSK